MRKLLLTFGLSLMVFGSIAGGWCYRAGECEAWQVKCAAGGAGMVTVSAGSGLVVPE